MRRCNSLALSTAPHYTNLILQNFGSTMDSTDTFAFNQNHRKVRKNNCRISRIFRGVQLSPRKNIFAFTLRFSCCQAQVDFVRNQFSVESSRQTIPKFFGMKQKRRRDENQKIGLFRDDRKFGSQKRVEMSVIMTSTQPRNCMSFQNETAAMISTLR